MRTPYGGSARPEGQSEEQVPYRGVDMRRTVFNEDHEAFRRVLRDFIEAEVTPHYQDWYEAGIVPRDFYYKLAELGLFGIEVPEEYGGAGITSFKYTAIESEETARAAGGVGGVGRHG